MKKISLNVVVFLTLLSAGILSGCNSKSDTGGGNSNTSDTEEKMSPDIKKIDDNIMALHEETMSKMDSMMILKSALKKQLDAADQKDKDSINANISRVQKANDAMMDWMHDFHEPDANVNHDSAMAYMQDQLIKIQGVKAQIRKSFDQANSVLHNSSTPQK